MNGQTNLVTGYCYHCDSRVGKGTDSSCEWCTEARLSSNTCYSNYAGMTVPIALEMRDWYFDVAWGDDDMEQQVDNASDDQVCEFIDRHYGGGVGCFIVNADASEVTR